MRIDEYAYTSAGGRSYNEDSVGMKALDHGGLYVVADGLGGHLYGEMASSCAVNSILESFQRSTNQISALKKCFSQANENILALQKETHSKMKSTAVGLLIQGEQAYWAHVGDSRLYYIHNGEISAITADHSVAYKKYLTGEITRSQIAMDEDQASLLRTLGNPNRSQPDVGGSVDHLSSGDGFLLCSDGLWEYVRDQEILAEMLKTKTAKAWAQQLLLRVMERASQGNDNLSLITIRIF